MNIKTSQELDSLSGQIERITYENEENGYTVARLKVYGRHDLVTVVGNLAGVNPGEILLLKGTWATHEKFGEQFKVVFYQTKVPASVYGIKKYLGSGLVKGIGPKMAERIVTEFGKETLDVIESETTKLLAVDGIGQKRVGMIQKAWQEQKEIREVMIFLQSHGVSSGYATKIFKTYGNGSIEVVKENPYQLATDIFGIGFITADKIAEKLGFLKDSPFRIQAGTLFVLHQLADEGHVYYPYLDLITKCNEILSVSDDAIKEAFGTLVVENRVVMEDLNERLDDFEANHKAIYLSKYHLCETRIAQKLTDLNKETLSLPLIDPEKGIKGVEKSLAISLAPQQIEAIKSAILKKVLVITGGPGTGKTTIISGILELYRLTRSKIILCAPTGRAAKRMSETTGMPAKTIHRLLEFNMGKGGFQKNDQHPLSCDIIIVDEASMIDTILMHHLLKAIPMHATLILVGDVNQLPSVGAGGVLRDIIDSKAICVTALNEIFRQAKKSRIITNAHRILQGYMPELQRERKPSSLTDFYFIEKEEPEDVLNIIVTLCKTRIPRTFGCDPMADIQVITPMHRGVVGAGNLNIHLQGHLNSGKSELKRGDRCYREGDKVMQIRNNYEKEVFNGDIGYIVRINDIDKELIIEFDARNVRYDYSELDEIVLAYAISVHKSQGSEYKAVVIPILTQHYILLQRNLIYTAITRGRELVVVVGTKKALAIGIRNDKTRKRYSYLNHRLWQMR